MGKQKQLTNPNNKELIVQLKYLRTHNPQEYRRFLQNSIDMLTFKSTDIQTGLIKTILDKSNNLKNEQTVIN